MKEQRYPQPAPYGLALAGSSSLADMESADDEEMLWAAEEELRAAQLMIEQAQRNRAEAAAIMHGVDGSAGLPSWHATFARSQEEHAAALRREHQELQEELWRADLELREFAERRRMLRESALSEEERNELARRRGGVPARRRPSDVRPSVMEIAAARFAQEEREKQQAAEREAMAIQAAMERQKLPGRTLRQETGQSWHPEAASPTRWRPDSK